MKKIVILLILVCTAFVSFAKGVVRTTTTDLSLRVDASTYSRVILTIPQGTQVYLQEDCDCVWVYVTYNGYCGYVNAQFLTKSIPANTTTAVAQEPIRHYTNSYGNTVQSPTRYNKAPAGATALCRDGSYSFSQSRRGTCSHHGGVARWL